MNSTPAFTQHDVSVRAYQIWEAGGRPIGQDAENWLRAEHELHAFHARVAAAAHGKSVEPPPAHLKHVPEKAPHSANYVHPGVTTDSLRHQRH